MWIAISRENEISSYWSDNLVAARIDVFPDLTQEFIDNSSFIRISQIFNLEPNNVELPDIAKTSFIRYCFFQSPMRALGQIKSAAKNREVNVSFGYGISSRLILANDESIIDEVLLELELECLSYEQWEIDENIIRDTKLKTIDKSQNLTIEFKDYSKLPISIQNIFEELHLSLNLLTTKVNNIPNPGLFKIEKINIEVNSLIDKILKYQELIDSESAHISRVESIEDLTEASLSELKSRIDKSIEYNYHKNQYVDRAIQLVSIISYVSTQTFSGVIPILSRRSLIRRHSLSGIGSGILALYRITNFIESIFHSYNLEDKITKDFKKPHTFLPEIIDPHQYSTDKWKYSNIDKLDRDANEDNNLFKLPYFSARLGFRESEYAISAAIQSITNGADKEWSIMTLTHELMHSQVRQLLNLLLAGDLNELDENEKIDYYETFKTISLSGFEDEHSLLDCVRYILLTHCCLADKYGSLTVVKTEVVSGNKGFNIPADYRAMFKLLMHNFRNINEIFVHVFDLNYIYRGQIDFYIKSIWHSWSSLPHIDADIRQYILRCLIVISTKVVAVKPFERFRESVSILKSSLVTLHSEIKKPLLARIILMLDNLDELSKEYYGGFYSYLMLVDLITHVFISERISGKIYKDDFVKVIDQNEKEELDFIYDLPDNFEDILIESPVAFLLSRIRDMKNNDDVDYARETCKLMLSII